MKAVALVAETSEVKVVDRPEPEVSAPDEIKVGITRVGICGTDREKVKSGDITAPPGRKELVLGHEMLGEVVETGRGVTLVKPGDYVVFSVRRGCGKCMPCAMNRSDMCLTGEYKEHGLRAMDGFQAEYAVDKEEYAVRVPKALEAAGVLAEPFSVVEKAMDEILRVQFARLPAAAATPDWFFRKRSLVVGLGPVGLLAALALRLRGAEVYGLDIVGPESSRPGWLSGIGGMYVDGRKVAPEKVDEVLGPMDIIIEAAGVAGLAFNILDALASNGIYVLTGLPPGSGSIQIHGAELMRKLVHGNQVMMGSVNSVRGHFQMAVDDMLKAEMVWKGHLGRLVTHRYGYSEVPKILLQHPQDEIKGVVEWKM